MIEARKPKMSKRLITVSEAARLKGLSRSAIYKAIRDGRLPERWELGRLALKESEVLAWEAVPTGGKRHRLPQSETTKSRISEAQKRRWTKRKREI